MLVVHLTAVPCCTAGTLWRRSGTDSVCAPLSCQYGEDAAKEGVGGGGGGGGMADIFDLFGGGGGRRAQRERRGEDVVHRLKVTLEELYNGSSRWDLGTPTRCVVRTLLCSCTALGA